MPHYCAGVLDELEQEILPRPDRTTTPSQRRLVQRFTEALEGYGDISCPCTPKDFQ